MNFISLHHYDQCPVCFKLIRKIRKCDYFPCLSKLNLFLLISVGHKAHKKCLVLFDLLLRPHLAENYLCPLKCER